MLTLTGHAEVCAAFVDPTATVPVEARIAETLRYDPPARSTQRVYAPDVLVTLDLASANRDPSVFEAADLFRPGRRPVDHLGFGYGPRSCPGQAHASALASGVLEALLH